jgi:small subunit ribosomal protein S4
VARYLGPKAKLSRREGTDLYLKSARRAISDKAKFDSKPGQHGRTSGSRTSDFGLQLREKQKVKRLYRMQEGQFGLTFDRAAAEKGVVGEVLLSKLERRLDNVIYRLGFGASRDQARQLVRHGHVKVNDKKVNIPSYQVEKDDVVSLGSRAAKNAQVTASVEAVKGRGVPKWLELDAAGMKGRVISMPARDDVNFPIQEQLIVELYSK